jgi:hypothetical protein
MESELAAGGRPPDRGVVDEEVQRARELLEEFGAEDTDHPSGTLAGHLRGTYEYLRRWRCPRSLCLAGLYHSIYGTDVFETVTLSPDARDKVRALIGSEAERVAFLYCSMVRESLYENLAEGGPPYRVRSRGDGAPIELAGAQEYASLLTLDLANRLEQLSASRWSRERLADDRHRYLAAVPLLPPLAVTELRAQHAPAKLTRTGRRLLRNLRRRLRA